MPEQGNIENIEEMRKHIGDLEELNETLRQRIEILTDNINILHSNNKTLTQSNKILKNDNEELRKLNEEITKRNETLENQYEEINQHNGETKRHNGEINKHNGERNDNYGESTTLKRVANEQIQIESKENGTELLAKERQRASERFESFFTLEVLNKAGFKEIPMKKRDELKAIFLYIAEHPNVQHQVVQRELKMAKNTLSKRIRTLKDFRFIRRNGSKKIGGYVLAEEGMKVVTG
jgi:chromosome segregation ATPase